MSLADFCLKKRSRSAAAWSGMMQCDPRGFIFVVTYEKHVAAKFVSLPSSSDRSVGAM
jgi:hypothetical protein